MRDATARIILSVLAAILLAVQFPAPAPSGASAHGVQEFSSGPPATHTVGPRTQDPTPTGQEYTPCGLPTEGGESNGSLRTRDRHRVAVQSTSETLSRCFVTGDTAGRPPVAVPVTPAHAYAMPRSSASHSPAALQVFRC